MYNFCKSYKIYTTLIFVFILTRWNSIWYICIIYYLLGHVFNNQGTVKSHNLQHGLNLQHVCLFTFSWRPLLCFPSFFQEPFETMSHTILSKNEDRRINSSEEEKEKQEKITWHQKTHTAGRFTTFP